MPTLPTPSAAKSPAKKASAKKASAKKGHKKAHAKPAAATAPVAKASKKGSKKSVRSRLKAAGGTVMATAKKALPAIEIVGGASLASMGNAYMKARGMETKIGGIDYRIVGGLGMHLLGMFVFPKHAAAQHVMDLGTGVLGSFLIDAARDYGASMAPKKDAAATTETKGLVQVGEIDESGAVKPAKAQRKAFRAERREDRREDRIQRKTQRVQKREDRVRRKLGDQGPETTASAADRRPVLVVPEDGAYNMEQGRYVKVGALSRW